MIRVKIGKGLIVNEQINFIAPRGDFQQNNNNQNIPSGKIKIVPKKKLNNINSNFLPEKLHSLNKTKEVLSNIMNRFFPVFNDADINKTIEEQERLLNQLKNEKDEKRKFGDILLSIDGVNENEVKNIISLNEKNDGWKNNSQILNFIRDNKLSLIEKIE
jgi:predicted CopG family antitoxin